MICCDLLAADYARFLYTRSHIPYPTSDDFQMSDAAPGASPRLYEGMDITGVTGVTNAQVSTLKALGAVEIGNRH